MEDFVAKTSRPRMALMVVGSLALAAIGLWMSGLLWAPPVSRRASPEMVESAGWAGMILFGLCVVMGAKLWLENSEQLRIGQNGIRYSRWSDQVIPWSEIENVSEWRHKGLRSIILHLRQPSLFPGRGVMGIAGRANRALTGGDISISLTGVDRSFNDAMAAIQQFRPGSTAPPADPPAGRGRSRGR